MSAGHWPEIARNWQLVGSPLRPSEEDLGFYCEAVSRHAGLAAPLRALILGVTPELYHLPWPAGAKVTAVDQTPAMVEQVWPGLREQALLADWTDMPVPAASCDLVFCDGGLHLLPYPQRQQQLVRSLHRVLALGGICVFRLFVPPQPREMPIAVLSELLAGRVANVNLLKLRLGMALQEDPTTGVKLCRIWDTLQRAAPDLPRLAREIGWPLAPLEAINSYRENHSRYYFVSRDEVQELFTRDPGGFAEISVRIPGYELGACCPTVAYQRRG